MKTALVIVNLALLTIAAVRLSAAPPTEDVAPIVRARVIELVDDHGVVRSRLQTEPDGEVVFRLFDQRGTIRVKLGANEGGSGLMLADETTAPGVHLVARRAATGARPATTALTLVGGDDRRKVVAP